MYDALTLMYYNTCADLHSWIKCDSTGLARQSGARNLRLQISGGKEMVRCGVLAALTNIQQKKG